MSAAEALRYLALPLRIAPLLLIAIFSVLLLLAFDAGLLGIPLALLLLSWFFKYAFVLLDRVADGAIEPPVLALEMVNPASEQRPLVLLALIVGLAQLAGLIERGLGPRFAAAAVLVLAALLPAVIAVQGVTGSVLQSFNPRTCIALVLRLGRDYLLVLAGALSFWLLGQVLLASAFGVALPLVVRIALLMYGWLAMFALIGGALYERRFNLGLEAAHSPERTRQVLDRESERLRDRELDLIYAQWRGGAHANAWQTILKQLEQSVDALAQLRWLHARTARWPDTRLAERLAKELLTRLLAARIYGEALDIVRERLRVSANFRPATSAELLTLAQLARDAGDRPTVRALLREFAHFYPDDRAQAFVDKLLEELAAPRLPPRPP